jgi:hypothetical protein
MSKANRRIAATVIACLAAGLLLLAGRARAADADPLKDAEARRKIAAEAAERDVHDARDEAYQTARTQPAKALDRIKGLLKFVDANPYFTDDKRDALTVLLKRDLANIQRIADAAANPDASGFRPGVGAPDPRAEEHKKLIDSAVNRITSAKEALADAADVRAKKSDAIRNLLAQVDRSSIPPTSDFEFPSREEWMRISKLRSKNNTITATEKAILKALATTISVDFTDQKFGGVIDWFEHQTGQTIILDKGALGDLGVSNESTVNLHLNKVSTRTALKKVLADLGLTYIVKDEAIYVTTPEKAKDYMTVRTYYIGDLMPAYDLSLGPVFSQYQAVAMVGQLVQMIQNNIDPESWEINGKEGGGTVVFDPVHLTLIVKQSAEIHYKMMQGLLP